MQGACLSETSFFKNYFLRLIYVQNYCLILLLTIGFTNLKNSTPPKKKGSCNELGDAI